jgi:M6 family metalloprotease-like protein
MLIFVVFFLPTLVLAINGPLDFHGDPCSHFEDADYCKDSLTINDVDVSANSHGNIKNLILLIRFKDHLQRKLPSRMDYEQLANGMDNDMDVNPTGSIQKYYYDQSYGKLNLTSKVYGWIDVPFTEKEAAGDCSSLCLQSDLHFAIENALKELDVDFTEFADENRMIKLLTIIHSGYGAEFGGNDAYNTHYMNRIWSHRWSLRQSPLYVNGVRFGSYNINPGLWGISGAKICRIGVLVHELGHMFGLPDLYDRAPPYSSAIGSHDVMCNAWGVDGSQYYPGSFSPWTKYKLGWVKPKPLVTSGWKTINPYQLDGDVYILDNNFPPNEYVLIESRSNDRALSIYDYQLNNGIFLWHVDESIGTNNDATWPGDGLWPSKHLKVRLIQRDNQWDMEKKVHHYTDIADSYKNSDQKINDYTAPSLKSYSQNTTGYSLSQFSFNNKGVSSFYFSVNENSPTTHPTTQPLCTLLRKKRCKRHRNCRWRRRKCINKN